MAANANEEKKLIASGYKYVAGVDETGMGSLAGDVYVAAVIFPPDMDVSVLKGVDDSKKKTKEQRERLCEVIKKYALSYAVATASVEEINIHNIYWARFIAARRALGMLTVTPNYVLIDGNAEIPDIDIEQTALVKGDSKSISIAAASILAKVARDEYITELSKRVHSDYGWESNKAYYTAKHVQALAKYGKTPYHRDKFVSKFVGDE